MSSETEKKQSTNKNKLMDELSWMFEPEKEEKLISSSPQIENFKIPVKKVKIRIKIKDNSFSVFLSEARSDENGDSLIVEEQLIPICSLNKSNEEIQLELRETLLRDLEDTNERPMMTKYISNKHELFLIENAIKQAIKQEKQLLTIKAESVKVKDDLNVEEEKENESNIQKLHFQYIVNEVLLDLQELRSKEQQLNIEELKNEERIAELQKKVSTLESNILDLEKIQRKGVPSEKKGTDYDLKVEDILNQFPK